MNVFKRFLALSVGLCFMISDVFPMQTELEKKLKNLKDNLVLLKKNTDQLQAGLIKLKRLLSGEMLAEEEWKMPEWKVTDALKSLLATFHGEQSTNFARNQAIGKMISLTSDKDSWDRQKDYFAQGKGLVEFYGYGYEESEDRDSVDPILYAGVFVQYILEPQGEFARKQFDEKFPQDMDAHFDQQELYFQDFKKIISACANFIMSGKIEKGYENFCKADSPVIKKFDLMLDEITLCCQDFIQHIDKRYGKIPYEKIVSFFGTTMRFNKGLNPIPVRKYDATGPICPDDKFQSGVNVIISYDRAKNLLIHPYDLASMIESNDWSSIRQLVDYFDRCINREEKKSTDILNDVLTSMKWRTQGLVLAYILLREGFADPEFLWWATGAILFYVGQGDDKIGYRQKQGADFACYQLLQLIKNNPNNEFESIKKMCTNYIQDFAKNISNLNEAKKSFLPDKRLAYSETASKDDTNINSSVTIAVSGNKEKEFPVVFTGAIRCFGGGNGYTKYGVQAKADILGMLRLQELLRLVREKRSLLNKKDTEKKAKEEAKKPELKAEPKTSEPTVDPMIAAIAVELEEKPIKKPDDLAKHLEGLVPKFTKIASIEPGNDIILESIKQQKIDLAGFFIYFIKNHAALAGQENYKKLLMLSDVIVRNILQSKVTVESLCLNMQGSKNLQTLAVFVAFLTSLKDDNFAAVNAYKVEDRLNLASLNFVDSSVVKLSGINLFRLFILLGSGIQYQLANALIELRTVAQADTGMGVKHNLISACFERITAWMTQLRYSKLNLQSIVNALKDIDNAYVKETAAQVVKAAEDLLK